MRSTWILGPILLFGLCASLSVAQPPDLINFQGVARDSSGQPIDGSHGMIFRFYDTEVGTFNEILLDTHDAINGNPVTLTNGLFNVVLGEGIVTDGAGDGTYTSLGEVFRDHDELWVSIQVDAEVLAPRIRFLSAGFALKADMVDGLHATDTPVAGELCALDTNARFPNSTLYTGAGNGLDADLLDGQEATFFQDAGSLVSGTLSSALYSAYLDLASEGYLDNNTAGDLLTQAQGDARYLTPAQPNSVTSAMIVDGTVSAIDLQDGVVVEEIMDDDGTGSGLDSDLLDGQHGSFYRSASNLNAGTLNNARFSSYSDLGAEGRLDNNSSTDLLTRTQADGRFVSTGEANSVTSAMIVNGAVAASDLQDGAALGEMLDDDGPGSGLNSDLLDNLDGSAYRNAGNINSGTLNDARFSSYSDLSSEGRLDDNSPTDLLTQAQGDARFVNEGQAVDADSLDGFQGSQYLRSDTSDTFTSGNLSLAAGTKLLVGSAQTTHNLVVESSDAETMRLIGAGANGSGARLNFGDSDWVSITEVADDELRIYSEGGVEIFTHTGAPDVGTFSAQFSGVGVKVNDDLWIGDESAGDDDTLYFDRGAHYLQWDEGDGRFFLNSGLYATSTIKAGRYEGLGSSTFYIDPDWGGISGRLSGDLEINGDLDVVGTKNFVQPHPSDPSKEIRFAALEGNESGTYFRGSSGLVDGQAVIPVPEDFRLASEAEGISVQLTPRGPDSDMWVESVDPDQIVVRGFEDVEFDFFVNGVRRGFGGIPTIRENRNFVPEKRGLPFGLNFPEIYRRMLVENGILNPDYTPNEATATRLGWTLGEPTAEERAASDDQLAQAGSVSGQTTGADSMPTHASPASGPESSAARRRASRVQSTEGHMQVVLDRGADDEARFSIFRDGAVSGELGAEVFRVDESGNVYAMGSFRPSAMDVAEYFAVSEPVEPGDLLVADPDNPGQFRLGRSAADPSVIGIVSAEPGVLLGSGLTRIAAARPDLAARLEEARGLGELELEAQVWAELETAFRQAYAPVALTGTVLCKVDAGHGAIRPGDLLTTSPTPGFAARADDPQPGVIVGKALEALETGQGWVRALVMLR